MNTTMKCVRTGGDNGDLAFVSFEQGEIDGAPIPTATAILVMSKGDAEQFHIGQEVSVTIEAKQP